MIQKRQQSKCGIAFFLSTIISFYITLNIQKLLQIRSSSVEDALFFSPPQQEQDVAAVAVVNNTDDKLEDARPIPTPTPAAAAKKNWEPSKSGS